MVMRTPDEMMDAAKEQMLDGRDPVTYTDWKLVVNFLGANLHEDAAVPPPC